MFIARSAARVRRARVVFLVAGLLPCVALLAWAVHIRSAGHRESLRQSWQQRLGLAIEIGSVAHLRPGAVRAERCSLLDAAGQRVLELPSVEAESAATEDRLLIGRLRCDEHAAKLLAALARDWLHGEARFPRDCIVEVADFRWDAVAFPVEPTGPATPVRVECVAQAGSRAIRIVRHAAAGDEVRIVRTWTRDPTGAAIDRVEIEASCTDPVPWAIAAALLGGGPTAGTALGPAAVATGTLRAARERGAWSGTVAGRITQIDAAACATALGSRAAGTATVDLDDVAWQQGRLCGGTIGWSVGPGWIDGRLLDRIGMALGCQPQATPRQTRSDQPIDAMSCVLRVGPNGVQILPAKGLREGLAMAEGRPLLLTPAAVVPFERLAWMLAAPDTAYVPASGPGAWLMSVLPEDASEPPRGGPQATNPPPSSDNGAF
jgi:hypothetical protein